MVRDKKGAISIVSKDLFKFNCTLDQKLSIAMYLLLVCKHNNKYLQITEHYIDCQI